MNLSTVKFAALCLTHNCNLRCKYCYTGIKKADAMTIETGKASIDFLHSHSNGNCTITFFGGEPLLEIAKLKEIVEYSVSKYGEQIQFRLSTNGVFLDKENLSYFKEHGVFFVLSIDGSQRQHDLNRITSDGNGSFKTIERKIPEILKFNPYTIIVSVLSPSSVLFASEGVKHIFGLGFRYLLQTLDYSAKWKKSDLMKLRLQYQDISDYYEDSILHGQKIYYSPFDERIKTHAQAKYTKGDICDLANSQIAIAASGHIYPCVQFIAGDGIHEQENCIGDVRTGFNTKLRSEFVALNYSEKDSCSGCALLGRCATYCGCVNYRSTGCINKIPPIICEHERLLMPIIDKLANRLWTKKSVLFKRKFYEKTFPVSSYIEDCLIAKGA